MPTGQQGIRLFQFRGIAVFLHWSWFLVAAYEIGRPGSYSSVVWNAIEYLALFAMVTLHEFGHAFACRSVGGRADTIVLWPLGGVAYVDPPERPGAVLWSIAAGPLVNLLLIPALLVLGFVVYTVSSSVDLQTLVRNIAFVNVALLVFNLLPIYPLDGGQILGALLWFVIGRARGLVVSAVVGLVGLAGLALLSFRRFSGWLLVLTFFLGIRCVGTLRRGLMLKRIGNSSLRADCACPACHANPPVGAFWTCASCGTAYDLFEPGPPLTAGAATTRLSLSAADVAMPGQCPMCATEPDAMKCGRCGSIAPIKDWRQPSPELARA